MLIVIFILLQLVPLDVILSLGSMESSEKHKDQLKALAFSVFSQCHQIFMHQTIAKSLTGFGPAAAQDVFLKNREVRISFHYPFKWFFIFSSLFDCAISFLHNYKINNYCINLLFMCFFFLLPDTKLHNKISFEQSVYSGTPKGQTDRAR